MGYTQLTKGLNPRFDWLKWCSKWAWVGHLRINLETKSDPGPCWDFGWTQEDFILTGTVEDWCGDDPIQHGAVPGPASCEWVEAAIFHLQQPKLPMIRSGGPHFQTRPHVFSSCFDKRFCSKRFDKISCNPWVVYYPIQPVDSVEFKKSIGLSWLSCLPERNWYIIISLMCLLQHDYNCYGAPMFLHPQGLVTAVRAEVLATLRFKVSCEQLTILLDTIGLLGCSMLPYVSAYFWVAP